MTALPTRNWYRMMSIRSPNITFPAECKAAMQKVVETIWSNRPPDLVYDPDHHPFRWQERAAYPDRDDVGFWGQITRPVDGHYIATVFPTTAISLDGGGMWAKGQPVTTLDWLGLTVSVPCDHLESLLACCKTAAVADHAFPHYEISGFRTTLILLPEDMDSLIALLEAAAPDAERRSAEFWQGREHPETVLRRAQGLPDDFVFPVVEDD